MDDADIVELQARSVAYYSPGDEEAFFEWLDRIECVEGGSGSGDTLYISVDRAELDEECLTELLALFRRYGVDLKQLRVFDSEEFASWFRNPEAFWYAEVFG
ncbi:hypothetical protein [Fundidesulfovibrio agrisoli]|uniref:hypothetical protein n=1 Tax=Fundidesulfovibrio agrisoli TaxID=2922717 RepID=UPI001FABCCC7|nr:hypothetical protein [Fundidesulfovibrio agrisoli]